MQRHLAPRFTAFVAGAALVAGSLLGPAAVVGAEPMFPPGPSVAAFPPGPYVTGDSADGVIIHDAPALYPPGPTVDGIIVNE